MNIIPTYYLLLLLPFFYLLTNHSEGSTFVNNEDSIEIGKKIYSTGLGTTDQKIIAISMGQKMPASIFACAKCHGKCGSGQLLQGIDVPDIRRDAYIKRHLLDSKSPNLDKEIKSKLRRLITLGINHSDVKVNSMMPKYNMSNTDMDHLLAFLAVLGSEQNCKTGERDQ